MLKFNLFFINQVRKFLFGHRLSFYFLAVGLYLISLTTIAQSALVTWPLSNNFTNVNYNAADIDNAVYIKGLGIQEYGINNYNLGGDWWNFTSNNDIDAADYVQFSVSPKTGSGAKNIYITGLELEMEQIPWNTRAGPRNYRIDYSKTADFSSFITAATGPVNTSFTVNDIQFYSPVSVFSGETLYFRIYGYNSDVEGDLIIRKNDFTIRGYVEQSTTINPIPSLDFVQDCANTANLEFDLPAGFNPASETILIFAKAGSPINWGPSTALLSAYPTADNNLATLGGSSYENDVNARLVYRGTNPGPVQLINIPAAQSFYFVAYSFSNNGGNGNISAGSYTDGLVTGTIPNPKTFTGIGTSNRVNLEFTAPDCVEAILIVAKDGMINGVPSGDGTSYIPDPDYLGTGTSFDGGKVVYNSVHAAGSAGALSVFNLTNQITYSFKAFVRNGNSWSTGLEISAVPNISSVIITQIQSKGADFFEFMTLTRMDISNLNITDQGVCESGTIYRSFSEFEYENFFNAGGNSDIITPLTDIPAGTFVKVYSGVQPVDLDYSDGLIVLQNSQLNFDNNGDQALIYTNPIPGPFNDCGATPNPISAAIDFASSTGWISSGTPNDNTSYRPDTPAAFETLSIKGNSRFQKGNPRGDSTVIFAAIMDPSNWKHNNQNSDYWRLKKVRFQKSSNLGGTVVYSGIKGSEFTMDASGIAFSKATISTRYMVVVYNNGSPDSPANRFTCYQPDPDYNLAPDVVTDVSDQLSSGDPCGIPVTGNGKVVYFDYALPNSLTIQGLKCNTQYSVEIFAVNGNGYNMKRGSANKSLVSTTQDAGIQDTFYARIDGDFSGIIWSDTPGGIPQKLPPLSPCLKLIVQSSVSINMDINASFGELEIETGGRLLLNGMTINLQKNLVVNGSIIHNNGRFIFDGTAGFQEIITASEIEFYDIEVNKNAQQTSNQLFISGNIAVRNHVTIVAGDLQVRTSFSLRLISDQPDMAAALTAVPSGSLVEGNFIVERYLPQISSSAPPGSGQGVGWRYLSSPVKNSTFNTWNNNFITTGLTGSDYPEYPYNLNSSLYYFPNLQFYDESIDGVTNIGFDGDPNGAVPNIRVRRDISQGILPGQGVFVYLGPVPLTFDAVGEPITGEVVVGLSYTDHGLPSDDGWNLVANPYPSAVDWDLIYQSSNGITPFAYIYDATGSGNYIQIEAGGANHLIASSNAFWVKATGSGGNINFRENQKSPDTTVPFYKSSDNRNSELLISLVHDEYSSLADFTTLRINDNATTNYDINYDAYKWYSLNNYVPGLSTRIDSVERDFSINAFNASDSTIVIPLKANIRVAGLYRFSFDFSGDQFADYCPILVDKLTGNQIAIIDGNGYEFEAETNTVSDSARFEIVFTPALKIETFNAVCHDGNNGEIVGFIFNDAPLTYELYDADENVYATGLAQGEFIIDSLSWGFYRLEVSGYSTACPIVKQPVFIGQPAAIPLADVVAYNALCENSLDGEIEINWQDSSYYQLALFLEDELIAYEADASVFHSFQGLPQGDYKVQILNKCDTTEFFKTISKTDSMNLDFLVPSDTIYLEEGGYVYYQNTSVNGYNFSWSYSIDQEEAIFTENGEFTYTQPGTYTVVLFGESAEGCHANVLKQITVIGITTSIPEEEQIVEDFSIVYSADNISLKYSLEKEKAINLAIYDGLGRIYHSEIKNTDKIGTYRIPTETLAPGIYFIRIESDLKEAIMLRFVKAD